MSIKSDNLAEARERANALRESLPQSVDVLALGVRSKAPFQLLCTREALIWRTEELARSACDALERDDLAVGAILTRAVTENAASTWGLLDVLETRSRYNPQQLNDALMRHLAGSRIWSEFPQSVNVLTLLQRIDKTITGIMAGYNQLSELAHPNWAGVVGLYSKTDKENYIANFGRGLRGATDTRDMITNALLGSLLAFEHAYNRISDLMPAFLSELESL